ncbi:hypothetical protein AAFC00_002545 [Neodothiora populina]|uniref:PPM-type phosphatase domain-containing protein n=1 Tax=Neodothiora populina TaxID=2781224 RepID=A0ABR3P8S3_9PEZI
MRRAVVQNLRTFRRPVARKVLKHRNTLFPVSLNNNVFQRRALTTKSVQSNSSMRFRRVSLAVGATAAAAGAFYAYRAGYGDSATAAASRSYATTPSYTPPTSAANAGPASEEINEAVRKALVIEQGALYTAAIPENLPLAKNEDDNGRKVLEMMTPDQVTQKIRTNEESYLVGRGRGVVRYDVVQIPSNNPIEDDHAEKIIDIPESVSPSPGGSDWMFWGVFDGHSGWTTSAKLRQALISFVARELNSTYTSALSNPRLKTPSPDTIDAAIKKAFMSLDHEITHESVEKVRASKSRSLAAELLQPALSGSCALLSFYDSKSKDFRVACTGDSRAVLGRRGDSGMWTATPLSVDQTGDSPEEVARLRAEHPNEPYVVANGRILGGLQPTRAFGDAVYKWTRETQDIIKKNFWGRAPSKYLKTPPYVTAEPVVTTTKIQPDKGDFVVLATDGLWEMLTNEEVVGLVGMWLDEQASSSSSPASKQSWLKSWFTSSPKVLPVESSSSSSTSTDQTDAEGQRAPIRQQQWGVSSTQSERFVVQDKNAASHLVRNALGGKDQDMISALLTLPSPYSRRYRDDLTVEVIFFGESGPEKSGSVEVNREASAGVAVDGLRPKL